MGTSLYVGNLPWEATEDDLVGLFQDINRLDEVRAKIEFDAKTGKSRGFGFVEVPDERIEEVIQRMHGYELLGRELIVN